MFLRMFQTGPEWLEDQRMMDLPLEEQAVVAANERVTDGEFLETKVSDANKEGPETRRRQY